MHTTLDAQHRHLRELARRLAELAAAPANAEARARWARHNSLAGRQRPLLWVCPDDDGAWLELVPESTLQCEDPELRALEMALLKYLYQAEHFEDDFVFEPAVYFAVPGEYTGFHYGVANQQSAWGISCNQAKAGAGAYHLDSYLRTDADFEALLAHEVDFIPDAPAQRRLAEKYGEALDGIISVAFHLPYSVLVQSHLIELVHLRGLEDLLYDLYDEPERLMAVLRHMGESKARLLRRLEAEQRLFDNRINIYTGSGGLGYTLDSLGATKLPQDVKLGDIWGFADAQEFSNVSPQMFETFALENQKIGLSLFGMACYGCCEPLTGKYEAVFRHLPKLRRLSVSPGTDVDEAAEQIGTRAIYSWKPNPATVCGGFDEAGMLAELRRVAKATRDCHIEIILKDIRTVGGTPKHLAAFARLTRQAFAE
ncbi:hypothetical protein LJC60_11075 [Ruminococcaceae bacterium OttesenSCG-928-D13]|nr:hypothetical protein [Ruminococcaceae bacterium OttesenSCG-928-D13]